MNILIIKKLNVILFFIIALSVFAGRTYTTFKEIHTLEKPKFLRRKHRAWKDHARIIGEVKNPPQVYTLELFSPIDNKTIFSKKFNGDIHIYETTWIKPGTYRLIIKAEGYLKHTIEKLKIKRGGDILIPITFGKKVYQRRAH